MRALLAFAAMAGAAQAQPAPPTFLPAAELRALIAKAEREIAPGQPMLSQPLVAADGRTARLEYRQAVGAASIHEQATELFYVVEGAGTLVTGGSLTHPERRANGNVGGSGIEGGTSRTLGVGDVAIVPAGVAHGFSAIEGRLVLISLHMPAGAAPTP